MWRIEKLQLEGGGGVRNIGRVSTVSGFTRSQRGAAGDIIAVSRGGKHPETTQLRMRTVDSIEFSTLPAF